MVYPRRGIVTLVAFVRLFSTLFLNLKSVQLFTNVRFSNVSSNHLNRKMQNHIGCSCLTFLHCAFSNVSSKRLTEKMHSHIDYICSTFHQCAFSNVSSNCVLEKRHSHTGYICLTFLHCAFLNVSSNGLHENMQSYIGCICLTFLQCVLKAKIIIPKSASSSGNRPPHCLSSFSSRVTNAMLKAGLL